MRLATKADLTFVSPGTTDSLALYVLRTITGCVQHCSRNLQNAIALIPSSDRCSSNLTDVNSTRVTGGTLLGLEDPAEMTMEVRHAGPLLDLLLCSEELKRPGQFLTKATWLFCFLRSLPRASLRAAPGCRDVFGWDQCPTLFELLDSAMLAVAPTTRATAYDGSQTVPIIL